MRREFSLFAVLFVLSGGPSEAGEALGLWRTEPDRKNLISHIQIRSCGSNICGRVLRAFDASGQEVWTKNVGKELFWDMKDLGQGSYDGGTVFVPLLDVTAKAEMRIVGDRLHVRACKGPICDGQVWTRVK